MNSVLPGRVRKIPQGTKRISLLVENLQKKISFPRQRIKRVIRNLLNLEGLKRRVELKIFLVSDRQIRRLNRKFLKKDRPTDVLAFDYSGRSKQARLEAEIIISADTALQNSVSYKTDADYEICLYAAHAVLHILGYDDHSPEQTKMMRQKEKEYVH